MEMVLSLQMLLVPRFALPGIEAEQGSTTASSSNSNTCSAMSIHLCTSTDQMF